MRRTVLKLLAGVCAMLAVAVAHAQGYPDKPIHVLIPFAPGGGTDILARIIAPKLTERLGQSVVVENRPGAAGAIAARATAQAAPDGYTLMVGSISEVGINPSLYRNLPYDVWRDFVAAAPLASTPMVLVVNPSSTIKTAKDLVAQAQARPGKINYGSAGAGSGAHMAAELFRYVTKVDIAHVPYKGTGAAVADLLGGHVDVVFTTLPSVAGLAKSGQLRIGAVATQKRVPSIPDVPTFIESGVPGYVMDYWYGFFAPAATPKDVLARLQKETAEVLRMPDVLASFEKNGLEAMTTTPEQFTAFVKSDMERWATVVKAANITVD
jgi:tripartite-type tricarboxylate transporter receptor subunit TctC